MKKLFNILMMSVDIIKVLLVNSAINECNGTALCGDMVDHLTQMNRL